jgi:hypothetical protein
MERELPVIDIAQSLFKYIPYQHSEHLGCRHAILHFCYIMVQMPVVEAGGDFFFKDSFKFFQVKEKTAITIDHAAEGYIKEIIVPVAVFIAAFSVNLNVFFIRKMRVEKPMRGIEFYFS